MKQPVPTEDFTSERREMVEQQLRTRGIADPRILAVMGDLPREAFIPKVWQKHAYEDRAVEIGHGQTISQPFIVAFMTEKLSVEQDHRILEVGTGSGYQTAILARLARDVYSAERVRPLSERAKATLSTLGIENVTLCTDDGSIGLPQFAPFDRILVTAAAPRVPSALLTQLADGGKLVVPVGGKKSQTVSVISRNGSRIVEIPSLPCRFVRLIGREGWDADGESSS